MGTILKNGVNYSGASGGGDVSSYNELTDKPSIEGVSLTGNKTASDLGLAKASDIPSTDTYYSTSDTAETTLADGDYFPFQDVSANGKRKTLWSNIKSVLKTYFDTLYDLNKDDIVKYAECGTGASTAAKTANVSRGSFKLVVGSKVAVRFSYANTATSPTLNINSTGAKEIKEINSSGTYVEPTNWKSGDIITFIYNGSYYIMQPSFGTLPSLPVVGTITRAELYSTTEKVVGMWQDGRPLYQKTINFGALPNATTKSVAHGVSNIGNVIDSFGWALLNNTYYAIPYVDANTTNDVQISVSTTNINITTASDLSSATTAYITIRYTKTTDSANSYNYANENDYSTSEKIVGTWIDGSYLYQKTYTGTTGSSGSTTFPFSYTSKIKKMEGYIAYDGTNIIPIGHVGLSTSGNYDNQYSSDCYSYNGVIYILTGTALRSRSYALTIQYTK